MGYQAVGHALSEMTIMVLIQNLLSFYNPIYTDLRLNNSVLNSVVHHFELVYVSNFQTLKE